MASKVMVLVCTIVALSLHLTTTKTEMYSGDFLKSDHANNWAVLVCTSRFWFNYRHVANVLSMYRSVKRLGIPDSHIIVMLADDMACNARNPRPGTVFNNANQHINVYGDDIEVDYRGYEVTVENFIRILTGRLPSSVPRSKRLLSDERSNILVYMTGHGGDGFLKFQDAEEITSIELADAFEQMWQKRRYNEIFLMVDTCQAYSMTQKLYSPNILAVGSSLVGQDSLSHHEDPAIGVHVIDRYTYYVLQFLEGVKPDSKSTMEDLFRYTTPDLVISTPGVRSDLFEREPKKALVTDFFGSVHMIEMTNSSIIDTVQEENVCRGEHCPASEETKTYETSEQRSLHKRFPKATKKRDNEEWKFSQQFLLSLMAFVILVGVVSFT
ncbi:GPI-anchor transamidase-like [Montipora foliosa]|uniref:GPI-anchor transamidase-like n=1 Tax=Montipora foliosa TaxID=591990 RepID=UPI0035F20535